MGMYNTLHNTEGTQQNKSEVITIFLFRKVTSKTHFDVRSVEMINNYIFVPYYMADDFHFPDGS